MFAEQIEKLEGDLTVARDGRHEAERAREQALSDLRMAKQELAKLAAELETATAERDQLRGRLAKAAEIEQAMFDAESSATSDRKIAAEFERELSAKSEALRLTGNELDEVTRAREQLRAALKEREAELVSVRADFASASRLLEALRSRLAADKVIAAESRKLKLEADGDGG